MMLLRTWMIMWKEFRQIARDPRMLAVVVALPTFMILLYGYAINLDVRAVRMAVYDQSRSPQSRELVNAFARSGYFRVIAYPGNDREVTALLDGGRARMVLIIPARFARRLADGETAPVQVLMDGADSTTASTALGYAADILQQYSSHVALEAARRAGLTAPATGQPVENRARYWYNPELRSNHFTIPGLIAVILMMLAALLTSVTVVRERERGTIEGLLASPVRPLELMLGKLAPYVLIAFGDVLLVMAVSAVVFHVPLVGSPALVLALAGIFVIAALGIGLLISTVAPTQQVAMVAAVMATQLPTVLLSGFIFPISSMPQAVQLLTALIPATHFIRILRGIFLKGNTLAILWQPALVLAVIAVAMVLLSANRFRRTL
ncbi:MAG TPA: ABC transporter permease [Armatimonadota bacterium]|nr:ABC transporter permease [Armatimonadota bacterium]HOS42140.1 ABC transporter permease [Armatimonadota bacterium]